jgi:hypothetical protein
MVKLNHFASRIEKPLDVLEVDWVNVKLLHDAYWKWNTALNVVPWSGRGANIPEALTEAIACLCMNAKLIRGGEGDIVLPDGKIGEVKATSLNSGDLTSFSPSEYFDCLFFVQADLSNAHTYSVYDLEMSRGTLDQVQVSGNQSFKNQADQGRRPRFSIIDKIIIPKNLQPKWTVNVETKSILPH